MTGRYVLLLRGINVNPSTRVAMADLRALVSELGYSRVRTLLQSGNVVVDSSVAPEVTVIEKAITTVTGVRSRVIALAEPDFRAISSANPLLDVSDDLSKMVITFLAEPVRVSEIERPTDAELAPERLVLTSRAVYQWCPEGILQSRLKPNWWRQFGLAATTRNVRTVGRILELLDAE